MMILKKLMAAVFILSMLPMGVSASVITSFTGDDITMNVDVIDSVGGVKTTFSFHPDSTYTGDITGVWLGIDDAVFNPALIDITDISVSSAGGVAWEIALLNGTDPAGDLDLGNGVNLTGGSGFALLFDFDLGVKQDELTGGGNAIIDTLMVTIDTSGLLASHFDAAGARVQSSNGPEGSSKLAGSLASVPEPASGALLVLGLAGLFVARRRVR